MTAGAAPAESTGAQLATGTRWPPAALTKNMCVMPPCEVLE
jgi:hypothetical protein